MPDNKQDKYVFRNVAKDWRWLKLFLPFWLIFGGIPMIIVTPNKPYTITAIILLALLLAVGATIFCIKCFVLYLNETQKQINDLKRQEIEIQNLQKAAEDNGTITDATGESQPPTKREPVSNKSNVLTPKLLDSLTPPKNLLNS